MRLWLIVLLASLLSACSVSSGVRNPVGATAAVDSATGELRAQPALEVSQSVEVSAETGASAGALFILGHPVQALGLPGTVFSDPQSALLYMIYDPLAPNWSIKERALNSDTFHLALRAKSFRTGGDGEAIQIVKRRALQLQRERGYENYRILDYSEGVESSTPFSRRYSEGTIQLVKTVTPERR